MKTDPLVDLVHRAVGAFEAAGIRYAVVGALARNAWARPRATVDVDLAIGLDANSLVKLREIAVDLGLSCKFERPGESSDIPELLLYAGDKDASLRMDLLVAQTPFEDQVLTRRVRAQIAGKQLWVATPEDILVYKLVAGRSRDIADAEEIARARQVVGKRIDWEYVENWVKLFAVEDRLANLRGLLPTIDTEISSGA